MNPRSLKIFLAAAAALTAFNLGRYSVEFSGSVTAWVAVIGCVVALAASLYWLIFDPLKPDA